MRKYKKETTVNNTDFLTDVVEKAKNPMVAMLALRLVKCIDESGMTRAEVCEKTGIFPSNLSDYIHVKVEPKISQVDKLARVFNVSTDYLLGRAECSTPDNEAISKVTGLSDKAIEKLKGMKMTTDSLDMGIDGMPAIKALLESDTDILTVLTQYLFSDFEFGFDVSGSYKGKSIPEPNKIEKVDSLQIDVFTKARGDVYTPLPEYIDPDFIRHIYLKQIEEKLSAMMQDSKKQREEQKKHWKVI